jgi:uncharacterized protein YndB with AHSA1/START domain
VITRVIAAPRELVFKAWTEADHLRHWWGPKGFEWSHAQLDFRPGGVFHYCLNSTDGYTMWAKFVYQEIVAPERIVFVSSFSDPEGNTVRAPFSESYPLEVRNVLTLTESDGRTTLIFQGGPINATEEERGFYKGMLESMEQGFGGAFDQLVEYLDKM